MQLFKRKSIEKERIAMLAELEVCLEHMEKQRNILSNTLLKPEFDSLGRSIEVLVTIINSLRSLLNLEPRYLKEIHYKAVKLTIC